MKWKLNKKIESDYLETIGSLFLILLVAHSNALVALDKPTQIREALFEMVSFYSFSFVKVEEGVVTKQLLEVSFNSLELTHNGCVIRERENWEG